MTRNVPIDATCLTCRWFNVISDEDEAIVFGDCRRHAPSPTGWPTTSESGFCGDWQSDYTPVVRA